MRDKKEVEKLLITMRGDYLEKLPEKIEVIANTLHALAESKQNQCGLYDEMYRAVHNIKGTAGTYGLHVISTVCHQFEIYLNESPVTPAFRDAGFFEMSKKYIAIILHAIDHCTHDLQDSYPDINQRLNDLELTREGGDKKIF